VRSSWSRRGEIIEIGDVSKDEAFQCLKLQKIDEEQAARIYELVGGHIIQLKFIADAIGRNRTLEGTCIVYYAENRVVSHCV
jgi:hypothetical protein